VWFPYPYLSEKETMMKIIRLALAIALSLAVFSVPAPSPAATIPIGQGNPFTNGDLNLDPAYPKLGYALTASGVHAIRIGGDTTTQPDGIPGPWGNSQAVITGNAPEIIGKNIPCAAQELSGMSSNSWGMSDFANLGLYNNAAGTVPWVPKRSASGLDFSLLNLQNATLHCIQPNDATPAPQVMPAGLFLMNMDYEATTGTYTGTFALITRNDTGAQAVASTSLYTIKWIDVGFAQMTKSSANTQISDDNGCYSLAGAVYGIYKDAACTNLVDQITTDASGRTSKSDGLVPGTYYVKELKAPKGYALDTVLHPVKITAGQTTQIAATDKPQNNTVNILLNKVDAETTKNLPLGAATLEGAEFRVNYYDGYYTSTTLPTTPTRTWVVKTDGEGAAELASASGNPLYPSSDGTLALPLGTVSIQEIKAPVGYLLGEAPVYVSQVTPTGTVEAVTTFVAPTAPEQVKRGDLRLIKTTETTFKRMAGVPFKITSKTTGETHVITTDINGFASTESTFNPHSSEEGIWFGVDAPVNDKLAALPYDTYTLEELPCAANQGMTLIEPFEVTIIRDNYTVDLGTLTDEAPPAIQIHTTATEKNGSKNVIARERATIVDAVNYRNLSPGITYVMKGVLMDRSTETTLLAGGRAVTAEKTFTPTSSSGTVEVTFNFNASALAGKNAVVFEDCYQDDVSVALHADINNKDQTVSIVTPKATPKQGLPTTGDSVRIVTLVFLLFSSALSLMFIRRKRLHADI
jgi:LPXTG-motif cell wall-anchored protein